MIGKLKKCFIVFLVVLALVFSVFDAWWLYVFICEPDKEVVNTFNVGAISTNPDFEDEEPEEEYVIKVKYYSNENNNGLECLEIQFTGFVDENQTDLYSYGIQFVANDDKSSFDWEYNVDTSTTSDLVKSDGWFLNKKDYYNVWGSYSPTNSNVYYYKSSDDFTYDITGATSMGNGEGFLINIDDNIYKLNFNGNIINDSSENSNFVAEKVIDDSDARYLYGLITPFGIGWLYTHVYDFSYYYSYDIYDFAYMLYTQIQACANGKHSASLINLPDMFNYQIFDGSTYVDISADTNSKVSETVRNFYSIYIEKSADGIQKSTDSMFNCVNGTPQFSLVEDDSSAIDDYFYGRTILYCDIYDFDFINVSSNYCLLKLSDNFIDFYSKYASKIRLSICIDLDIINKNNIIFAGFYDDSGLQNFAIYECYTTETIDGEIVRTEVEYA